MALKGQKFRKLEWETKIRIVKPHLDEHISVEELARQEGTTSGMICRFQS